MIWTLPVAQSLVAHLQPKVKNFGYHITLGGGVLNNEKSEKDLDLFFLPLLGEKWVRKPDQLITLLKGQFHSNAYSLSKSEYSKPELPNIWKAKFFMELPTGNPITTLRIDVFILGDGKEGVPLEAPVQMVEKSDNDPKELEKLTYKGKSLVYNGNLFGKIGDIEASTEPFWKINNSVKPGDPMIIPKEYFHPSYIGPGTLKGGPIISAKKWAKAKEKIESYYAKHNAFAKPAPPPDEESPWDDYPDIDLGPSQIIHFKKDQNNDQG